MRARAAELLEAQGFPADPNTGKALAPPDQKPPSPLSAAEGGKEEAGAFASQAPEERVKAAARADEERQNAEKEALEQVEHTAQVHSTRFSPSALFSLHFLGGHTFPFHLVMGSMLLSRLGLTLLAKLCLDRLLVCKT